LPDPLRSAVPEPASSPVAGRTAKASAVQEDAAPLVSAPRPAGQPLSVRRATPELPRPRPARSTARAARVQEPTLNLDEVVETAPASEPAFAAVTRHAEEAAGLAARLGAALIDLIMLGGIDAVVVFLTARATGLSMTPDDLAVLQTVPFGAFLALLAVGYLVGFTAGGGQTIGKMALGLRVLSDDGTPVDFSGAVLRSLGALAAMLTLGLLYVPVLVTSDRRALHDRLAGTRVVRDRA
jgi:uncharacterized RDD family membrane protein YckC